MLCRPTDCPLALHPFRLTHTHTLTHCRGKAWWAYSRDRVLFLYRACSKAHTHILSHTHTHTHTTATHTHTAQARPGGPTAGTGCCSYTEPAARYTHTYSHTHTHTLTHTQEKV